VQRSGERPDCSRSPMAAMGNAVALVRRRLLARRRGCAGGRGVPELSGLGVLTWVDPPDLVDRVVAACGRAEQRRRLLPARLVVSFVPALALFSPAP
jgi:hypothetical protein